MQYLFRPFPSCHESSSPLLRIFMDTIFFLEADARAVFLRSLAGALECSYICLWSYSSHPPQFLVGKDGLYYESDNSGLPSSSSSSSIVHGLFNGYRGSFFAIESGRVPGLVTSAGSLYLELRDSQVPSLASTQLQKEFYLGAGIKTIAFLRCKSGEIEVGASTSTSNNWQLNMMNFCGEYFLQNPPPEIWQQNEYSRPSSSSSSLVSKSIGSPEYSSIFYNTDRIAEISAHYNNIITRPSTVHLNSSTPQLPMQSSHMGALGKIRLPSPSHVDEEMTKAMLAVISSLTPSSSSNTVHTQSHSRPCQPKERHRAGCFKPYNLAPRQVVDTKYASSSQSQSAMKRVMAFLGKMATMRIDATPVEGVIEQNIPMSSQMHHIMSERKRREKLNEFFGVLREILPPGTKKHKASVLSTTIERLGDLKRQVIELEEKNQLLQKQLSDDQTCNPEVSNTVDVNEVLVNKMSAFASEEQQIGVHIAVRNEVSDLTHLVIRLLECLKAMDMGCNLTTLDADTRLKQATMFNNVHLGLKVKKSEWEEQRFKDCMSRAICEKGKGVAG